ncbi:MAG: hypothetical protein QNK22_05950 [Xanthomonadales bacterium]|nr:hypothetical protein [Xanthomonadales bacterium]
MDLLNHFILQHCQVSLLQGELLRVSREGTMQDAKVEMNLTPRLMEMDSGDKLPSYQVSAKLICVGGAGGKSGPAFNAKVGLETVYQQSSGDPIDISDFTNHHASLARQIYPLLAQELRGLLTRMGLTNIQLPFDLVPGSKKITVLPDGPPERVH